MAAEDSNPFKKLLVPLPSDPWLILRDITRKRLEEKGERITLQIAAISNRSTQLTAHDRTGNIYIILLLIMYFIRLSYYSSS